MAVCAVLGTLAVIACVFLGVLSSRAKRDSGAAYQGPLVVPRHASGTGGSVITYGDPAARHDLDIYEDPRCPFCGIVERALGTTIQQLADEGKYKINYHIATFLDNNLGGSGSHQALNALGEALDQGTQKFMALHAALYRQQPEETHDDFSHTSKLLAIAAEVPGLDQSLMRKAVNDGTYLPWAAGTDEANGKQLSTAWKQAKLPGSPGTPAVFLDGHLLNLVSGPRTAISDTDFKALVTSTEQTRKG
ncbi:thioredoxin domain-containing protein [Streptomyces sp. cg36]|uniref:thioredoxin domain-containing protein n=1 Tax=Streptomyces sp. cg36 TaxID=3238798 RepID=UPI0034E2714A